MKAKRSRPHDSAKGRETSPAPIETDEEQQLREEEEEQRARTSAVDVKPIHDVPDTYVFRFQVGPAILAQLRVKLSEIPVIPLIDGISAAKYPGFYQLFLDGQAKYIGKTARPIGERLKEHVKKLRGRIGIDVTTVECKYAFVEDRSLVDVAEGALIAYFGEQGMAAWNQSGFGSKVTGHGRGRQRASVWSQEYPADLNLPITVEVRSPLSVPQLVAAIAAKSPLTLSIPRQHRRAFALAHGGQVQVAVTKQSFQDWVKYIERLLAPGWEVEREAETWYIAQRRRR